jgi:hypothetical protein
VSFLLCLRIKLAYSRPNKTLLIRPWSVVFHYRLLEMILRLENLNILRGNVIKIWIYLKGERLYLTCCAPYVGCYWIQLIFIISIEDNVFFLLVHLNPINKLLLFTVHSSAIYTCSTPKIFHKFSYMQTFCIIIVLHGEGSVRCQTTKS